MALVEMQALFLYYEFNAHVNDYCQYMITKGLPGTDLYFHGKRRRH